MFSLCEKYGGKRTYPLPVFAEKDCHAIPRGSSCARYVSKATKEMASGFPPIVPAYADSSAFSAKTVFLFFEA